MEWATSSKWKNLEVDHKCDEMVEIPLPLIRNFELEL